MKRKRKDIITIAIDSPAAAGAGTQAKYISKEYNLFYLDTGKIYRLIGKLRLDYKNKFNSEKNDIFNKVIFRNTVKDFFKTISSD